MDLVSLSNIKDEQLKPHCPQLKCVIWIATSPILAFAREHYEEIRKDLNIAKGLVTKKKDTSHIQLPKARPNYVCQYLPGSNE